MKFSTREVAILALSASYVVAMPNLPGNQIRDVDVTADMDGATNMDGAANMDAAADANSANSADNADQASNSATIDTLTVPGTNNSPDLSIPLIPVASITATLPPKATVSATVSGNINNTVTALISAVGQDLAAIQKVLSSVGSNVLLQIGGITTISIHLANIVYALITAGAAISASTSTAVARVDGPTIAALTSALRALNALLLSLGQTIGQLLSTLAPSLAKLIAGLINGLLQLLSPLLTPLFTFVSSTVKAAGGATNSTIIDLQTALTSLESTLGNLVQVTVGV